jgi:hypothetical protein
MIIGKLLRTTAISAILLGSVAGFALTGSVASADPGAPNPSSCGEYHGWLGDPAPGSTHGAKADNTETGLTTKASVSQCQSSNGAGNGGRRRLSWPLAELKLSREHL